MIKNTNLNSLILGPNWNKMNCLTKAIEIFERFLD